MSEDPIKSYQLSVQIYLTNLLTGSSLHVKPISESLIFFSILALIYLLLNLLLPISPLKPISVFQHQLLQIEYQLI